MMSVAFWRWWKLLQLASQHKRQTKENTGSDLRVHALPYANELLKNFSKLAKQTEPITNYQKQVWLWLSIVWETLRLTRHQTEKFFFFHSLQNKVQKLTRSTCASR